MLIEVDAFAANETADSPFDEAHSAAWDIIDAHPRSGVSDGGAGRAFLGQLGTSRAPSDMVQKSECGGLTSPSA
ncbi:hypothetical protein [Shinella granuli]|uniref:Uncharacterized protein n=1 Tax=Shinella granuli TaxID=323621 RepID=A0A4V6NLB9_SHIGR|nr:hypothetical protein EV665_105197 [Shinella granuli]